MTYHEGVEFTAAKAASVAEEIYPKVTAIYADAPTKKTRLIVRDDEDTSNGFAVFGLNSVTIWASPAQHRLRGKEDWIRAVVTHEFAHIVSLRASAKAGMAIEGLRFSGLQNQDLRANVDAAASVLIPTHPYARWWAEGTAQLDASTAGYDGWDSSRDMLLRASVLEGNLLTFDEMRNIGVREHFGGEMVYNQGYAFLRWLRREFGAEVNRDIARASAGSAAPDFDALLKKVTGVPARALYDRWVADLRAHYRAQAQGLGDDGIKVDVVDPNEFARFDAAERPYEDGVALAYPRFSPDGRWFSYVQRDRVYLRRLDAPYDLTRRGKDGPRALEIGTAGRYYDWSPDATKLVLARRRANALNGYPYFDLYVLDLARPLARRAPYEEAWGKADARARRRLDRAYAGDRGTGDLRARRITHGQRATHPAWSPDGARIAFSANRDGSRALRAVRPDGTGLEDLVPGAGGSEAYDAAWSPDGAKIAFTFSNHRRTDPWILDVAAKTAAPLWVDDAEDREPRFTRDGKSVVFASDRSGVFQLYRAALPAAGEAPAVETLTATATGAFMPFAFDGDREVLYARFSSFGFRAWRTPLVARQAATAAPDAAAPEIVRAQAAAEAFPAPAAAKPYFPWPRPLRVFPSFVLETGGIKRGFGFQLSDPLERHAVSLTALFGRERDFQAGYVNRAFVPTLFASYTSFVRDSTFRVFDDGDGIADEPAGVVRDDIRFVSAGISQDLRSRDFLEGGHVFTLDYDRRAVRRRLGFPVLFGDVPTTDFRLIQNDSATLAWEYARRGERADRDADLNPRDRTDARVSYSLRHTELYAPDATIPAPNGSYYHHEGTLSLARSFALSPRSSLRWHSLWFRFTGGAKSRDVNVDDEFYLGGRLNFRAFGQVSQNTLFYGYDDFGIFGESMVLLRSGYTFPVRRAIDRKWWIFYLDGIYASVFHEVGNAWDFGSVRNARNGAILLQSVGAELRIKSFLFTDFNRWNALLRVAHGFQDDAAHGFRDDDLPVRVYVGLGTEF